MKKLALVMGLGLLTTSVFATADVKPLLINQKNHDRGVNLGFATYDLESVINIISNDSTGYSEEQKAEMVGTTKGLTPFQIKRQRAELVKQYDEGIKIAKDYFSAGQLQIDGNIDTSFNLNDFERSYDFNDQVLAISRLNLCEESKNFYYKIDLLKKEDCTGAYIKLPEDKAEEIYNFLRKQRYITMQYSILASHQNKIESCRYYSNACVQADLTSATIKLVSNDKHKKVLFDAPLEFK